METGGGINRVVGTAEIRVVATRESLDQLKADIEKTIDAALSDFSNRLGKSASASLAASKTPDSVLDRADSVAREKQMVTLLQRIVELLETPSQPSG